MKLFEFDENIGDWRTLIQTRDIQNGAVRSHHIAGAAVTGDKIAEGEIKGRNIADEAVTGEKIAPGTIPGSKLKDKCITGDKIEGGTVEFGKLADDAVHERNIFPLSVTGGKISDNAIQPRHIPQGTVRYITEDVQNQIDGIQVAGVAVSNEFGNDPHIGISQKKLTEAIGGQQEAIEGLENSIAPGGSVDARIVGDASSGYDTLEKVQARIAEEKAARQGAMSAVYTKGETYSKAEINNMFSPDQKYGTFSATDQTTDVTDVLPATGSTDTIYRVANWDGAQYNTNVYSEYAWDGTGYVFLRAKNEGLDDDSVEGSSNPIKSGATYNYFETKSAGDYKFGITDKEGNAIAYVTGDDKFRVVLDAIMDNINGIPAAHVEKNDYFKIAFLDEKDNVIFGIDKNNKIVCPLFDVGVLYGETDMYETMKPDTICDRQKHMEPILLNDCQYDYNPSYNQGEDLTQNTLRKKKLQLAVVTDTHLVAENFQAAVDTANGFISVDAAIQLGDMCNWNNPEDDTYDKTLEIINSARKPLFITPGNHDLGTRTQFVKYCKDDVQLYNRFVKPAVDKGWLLAARPNFTYKKNGEDISFPKVAEYEENKVYYYHDFDEFKVRLIMLYPNDDGNVFDETYWTPIEYNSSYSNIAVGQYAQGDKVNVPGYTTYSFEAVQSVEVTMVTKNRGDYDEAFAYVPRFKALRRGEWYSQDQLDWLCNRLDEAGEHEYTCIICQHYSFLTDNVVYDVSTRFQNSRKLRAPNYEFRYPEGAENIIGQIIAAYQTGESIQKTITPVSTSHEGADGGYDDTSSIDTVYIDKTFSYPGKALLLHGHNHSDCVIRSEQGNVTDIGFISGTLYEVGGNDTNRSQDCKDTVTCLTVYKNTEQGVVHISRLGANVTNRIDPTTHTLIKKDNEIINF